jgi:hypothetical protein
MSLEDKTRPELIKLAGAAGIEEAFKKTKAELVQLLSEAEVVVDEETPKVEEEVKEVEVEVVKELSKMERFLSPFGRRLQAKGVLYTDGISGDATNNLERAYEYNERLQSNDPKVRASGDQSLSEAAKAARGENASKEAKKVTEGLRSDQRLY